jgi:mRNA interferase RelE/StbE
LAWRIEYAATAIAELKKLDKQAARRIVDYLDQRIAPLNDPRQIGKPLTGKLGDFWRYRVGDYRVVCDIRDATVTVLVVRVGARR